MYFLQNDLEDSHSTQTQFFRLKKPKFAILLGPNASGKGKTCRALHDEHDHSDGFVHVEMSHVVRLRRQHDAVVDRMVDRYIADRVLIPDDVLMPILFDYLHHISQKRRLLFDGVPRTYEQACLLLDFLRQRDPKAHIDVVQLMLPPERVLKNAEKRYGELKRHEDETPEVVEARRGIYEAEIGPILDHFRACGIDPLEVNADVPEAVQIAAVRKILQ